MQLLSYWIDVRLAGVSPQFAYLHQVCSFLVTLFLLYLFVARVYHERAAALVVSVLWVLLPSTAVVLQFAATRHYLEGLLFSALALCLLQRGIQVPAIFSMILAMLCKETYAVLMPAVVLIYAWRRREHTLAITTAAIICSYAAYQYWMLGPALSYDVPLPDRRTVFEVPFEAAVFSVVKLWRLLLVRDCRGSRVFVCAASARQSLGHSIACRDPGAFARPHIPCFLAALWDHSKP